MTKKQIQQGDVGLERVANVPKDATRKEGRTVAYGEATGHHHTFVEDTVELYEKDGVLYVNAPEGGTLTHQEHGTIEVEPGVWRMKPVHEYDYDTEERKRVID